MNHKINQLITINTDKARMLVLELQAKVKSFLMINSLQYFRKRMSDMMTSSSPCLQKKLEAVDQANSAGMHNVVSFAS